MNIAIVWPVFMYSNCILVLQKWSSHKDIDFPCLIFTGWISRQAKRAKESENAKRPIFAKGNGAAC